MAPPIVAESKYDERDVALYALGVGAAQNPLDPEALSLVYEMNGSGFHTLPTFAVVPAMKVIFDSFKRGEKAPGMNYGFERVLHGEQYTEVKRPLPSRAKLRHEVTCKDVYDKGKNAIDTVIWRLGDFLVSGGMALAKPLAIGVAGYAIVCAGCSAAAAWFGWRAPRAPDLERE